jgi:hypothetical protein
MVDESQGLPLRIDEAAESADPEKPAFLARPDGAPVYHGFPILDAVEVDGFRLGMITDWEAVPSDSGDAFLVAPDDSRCGLIWEVTDEPYVSAEFRGAKRGGASGTSASRTRWTRQRTRVATSRSCSKSCVRDGNVGGRVARSEASTLTWASGMTPERPSSIVSEDVWRLLRAADSGARRTAPPSTPDRPFLSDQDMAVRFGKGGQCCGGSRRGT